MSQLQPPDALRLAVDLLSWVWRTALDQPGYALLRIDPSTGSRALRRLMIDLVEGFGAAAGERFVPERLGRFDQQVTTKFHRDGAPAASLLVLGYEVTTVRSRFFVADAHRAADRAGMDVEAYLSTHNPMFPAGEIRLAPFITELDLPDGEPFVVVLNNSLMPFVPGGSNPLGVLHKGEIVAPDPVARRVINSLGRAPNRWSGIGGRPWRRWTVS